MGDRIIAPGRVWVNTTGLLTRRHRLMRDQTLLGELHLGLTTTYTDAVGRQVRLERPSPWRGEIRLREGTRVRASARSVPLERRAAVRVDDALFWLQRVGWASRAWEVVDKYSPVLTIRRVGWRRAEITVHAPIDGDLLAFCYYLVVTRWRARHRQRAA